MLSRFAVPAVALWIAAFVAHAAGPLQNQELLEKSGLAGQLRIFPDVLRSLPEALNRQGIAHNPKFERIWKDAVAASFDMEKILAHIDDALQKVLTAQDKDFLLAHYNSALGIRITGLEDREARVVPPKADPGEDAERIRIYREIDSATGGQAAAEVAMSLAVAVSVGMTGAMHGIKNLDEAAVGALFGQQRSEFEQQLEKDALADLSIIYRDLHVEELKVYLAFLKAPAAQKLYAASLQGLEEPFALQMKEFGRRSRSASGICDRQAALRTGDLLSLIARHDEAGCVIRSFGDMRQNRSCNREPIHKKRKKFHNKFPVNAPQKNHAYGEMDSA